MKSSYIKNYFKIYLWQGVSLVLNFLSMFIVIPYLTSKPVIYGIYAVCISMSIFLSYADLGFIGAGQKYAAEYFAKGKRHEEINVIGFTSFILLIFLLFFSIVFLVLSFHPGLIIKNIANGEQKTIASSLLLILALFTPITLLQRLLQMIFGIRLEDYIIQRTNIFASLVKIVSVFWFFGNSEYNIVGYFVFSQIISLFAAFLTLKIAKKRYNYNFKDLIKSIHFNKRVFNKTKTLAFSSLYLTISWILYYELDSAAIGRMFGAKQIGVFAIGLTILSFFRSMLGILFSPFNARFNHFIGNHDDIGLKLFFTKVTTIVVPIIVIPIITISLMAKPLVLSWVGLQYFESITIVQLLITCNIFAFISYPTSILLMAQERIKEMYIINTLIPLIYWIGIGLTYKMFGLSVFAFFKFVAFSTSAIVYFFIFKQYLDLSFKQCITHFFRPILVPVIFLVATTFFTIDLLPMAKSKLNLLIVAITIGSMIIFSYILVYFSSSYFKSQLKNTLALIKLDK